MAQKKLVYINYNSDTENPTTLGMKHVFGFGKYKYKRVDTIMKEDPQYLLWLCSLDTYKMFSEDMWKQVRRAKNAIESNKYKNNNWKFDKMKV